MSELPGLIRDLALISIYGGITTLLFKWLKQPVVLGYILAGIFVGPHVDIMPTVSDKENIHIWADIGVIFLLFSLGLEFSFKKIVNVGKAAMITANANILFLLFLGYQVGLMLGWSTTDSLFLGGMISMSSTTIIIKAFEELNMRKQPFTDLVFGILVVEDIVGILLLVLLPTIAVGKNVDGMALVFSTLKLGFFLVLWFVIGIYLIPTFLKKISKLLNDELLLLVSIGLCLGMVLLATKFGFSSALGAFIMGSILAGTDCVEKIEKIFKPVKDFFGAVFFVSVGMMVRPDMFVTYAGPIMAIAVLVILGQVIFSTFGLLLSGRPLETAVRCGFSLAQVGEFAFIIASVGMNVGVLSDQVYPIIVAVSVLTTFTTPMMIRAAEPFYNKIQKILPEKYKKFIDKHTSDKPATNAEESLWKELFLNYIIKLSVSSVVLVAIININFIIVQGWLQRFMSERYAAFLTTVLTLVMMSPFLKNLLSPREKVRKIYGTLWQRSIKNRFPLVFMSAFRVIILIMYIMVVLNHFLTKNIYITYLTVAGILLVLYKSQWLMKQYHRIEEQFLSNLYRNHEHKEEQQPPSE